MAALLDTDIVIHLRDGDRWTRTAARALDPPLFLSAIGRIELENGVWRDSEHRTARRAALDALLPQFDVLPFAREEIEAYAAILASAGFSRRKTADRLSAATALAHGLPVVTFNGRDFRDVPGLRLIEWVRPEGETG